MPLEAEFYMCLEFAMNYGACCKLESSTQQGHDLTCVGYHREACDEKKEDRLHRD